MSNALYRPGIFGDISELKETFLRYLAYGASSSGVEQNFSKIARVLGQQCLNAQEDREFVRIKLMLDRRENEVKEVCARAQEVWALRFGHSRTHESERIDKGMRRRLKAGDATESSWLRKRRSSVASALQAAHPVLSEEGDVEGWGASHEKELAFIKKKLVDRKVEAVCSGALILEENDTEIAGAVDTEIAAQEKRRKERVRHMHRIETTMCLHLPSVTALRGLRCFVEPGCIHALPLLETHLICHVADRVDADIFLAQHPLDIGQRSTICAVVAGAYIIDPSFLKHGAKGGVCVKYKAAKDTKRNFLFTEPFLQKHGSIAHLLRRCASQRAEKWRCFSDVHEHIPKFIVANRKHCATYWLALVKKRAHIQD